MPSESRSETPGAAIARDRERELKPLEEFWRSRGYLPTLGDLEALAALIDARLRAEPARDAIVRETIERCRAAAKDACEGRADSLIHDSKDIMASCEASKCGSAVDMALRDLLGSSSSPPPAPGDAARDAALEEAAKHLLDEEAAYRALADAARKGTNPAHNTDSAMHGYVAGVLCEQAAALRSRKRKEEPDA